LPGEIPNATNLLIGAALENFEINKCHSKIFSVS